MHILTGNGDVPHWEWGCASLGMGMCLTGNGDVPHWEWDVPHRECYPHREWGFASLGMGMCLIGNAHPHQECTWFTQGDSDISPADI